MYLLLPQLDLTMNCQAGCHISKYLCTYAGHMFSFSVCTPLSLSVLLSSFLMCMYGLMDLVVELSSSTPVWPLFTVPAK